VAVTPQRVFTYPRRIRIFVTTAGSPGPAGQTLAASIATVRYSRCRSFPMMRGGNQNTTRRTCEHDDDHGNFPNATEPTSL